MPGAEHLNAHSLQLSASTSCFIIHLKQEGEKKALKQQEDAKSKAHLSGDCMLEKVEEDRYECVCVSVCIKYEPLQLHNSPGAHVQFHESSE